MFSCTVVVVLLCCCCCCFCIVVVSGCIVIVLFCCNFSYFLVLLICFVCGVICSVFVWFGLLWFFYTDVLIFYYILKPNNNMQGEVEFVVLGWAFCWFGWLELGCLYLAHGSCIRTFCSLVFVFFFSIHDPQLVCKAVCFHIFVLCSCFIFKLWLYCARSHWPFCHDKLCGIVRVLSAVFLLFGRVVWAHVSSYTRTPGDPASLTNFVSCGILAIGLCGMRTRLGKGEALVSWRISKFVASRISENFLSWCVFPTLLLVCCNRPLNFD